MTHTWNEITLVVPSADSELVADFLVELTGSGVSTANRNLDTFSLDDREEEAETTLRAYLPSEDDVEEKLAQLRAFLKSRGMERIEPAVSALSDEDWAEQWKAGFRPFRVGERLLVKPTWEEVDSAEGLLVLQIDPGMAFGTGSHATTKMCLEALERLSLLPHPPISLLDVGTGSGILAIAGALLGMKKISGIDIDPQAVEVARENASLNGVSAEFSVLPLEEVPGVFDVVVANILAEDLAALALPLTEKVAGGGWLILSGILVEREKVVTDAFAGRGLRLEKVARDGEWSCIHYRREK